MDSAKSKVLLKKGREKSVLQRHPWIYSGSIARVEGNPLPGAVVEVIDARGQWLARGHYSPRSQIRVRLATWEAEEGLDRAFVSRRLQRALAGRAALEADPGTNAYRLVHAESDGLPGVVVDRYGPFLVVQILSQGAAAWQSELVELLAAHCAPQGIYERSDVSVRRLEGLPARSGPLWGREPPPQVEVLEAGRSFLVDLRAGQKTGAYLDQRPNRLRLAPHCAGREVLDAFSYTGWCAVHAAAAGAASVWGWDSSSEALELARENARRNGVDGRVSWESGNSFELLRDCRDSGRLFDVVILDPPKFASRRSQVDAATRGYKDINLLGMQLLRPGGLLATFSCSGHVDADLFQKVVFGAGLDAGRDAQILGRFCQGSDHPVLLSFPQGAYLKGLLCRVY
ncbi:MAG: class I SAM-dependent methyltransferase [Chloroflexia bacterium]|nr:class I SAM-dependent methyltransferase [Chloroflexia bacterium]